MRLVFLKSMIAVVTGLLALWIPVSGQETNAGSGRTADPSYRIQRGDKIAVKFFSHPDLNEPAVLVRPDGFISLQIIDDVRAEGRTAAELRQVLLTAYNETLLNPIISVSVIEFVSPRVFVGGQVNKPGRYELRDAASVVQMVFLAGGFTKDANRKMVIVARPEANGEWKAQAVNVMKILDPKNPDKDVELHDGDYVFVPDSKMSQFTKAVETFRALIPRIY